MIYLTQFQLSYIMIGFHNLKNTGGNYEKQNYMGKCEFNNSTLKGLVGDIITYSKYSLQGTTQGRYLTGGVPPVRFSM